MQTFKNITLISAVLCSITFCQTAMAGAIEEITAAENIWLKAQNTNDPNLLAPLLADNIVDVETDGSILDKKQILEAFKSVHFEKASYEDFKVTVLGDTGVATMIFRDTVTNNGKTEIFVGREMDTWAKVDGKWICIGTTNTPIKDE